MAIPSYEKAYTLWLKLIFGTGLLLLVLFVCLAHMRTLILFVPDDASYYLKIAQNVRDGNGFSFDGLHTTNGFHPLWQYLLVPFMWMARTSPENTMRYVLLFQLLLSGLSGALFYRALRKHLQPGPLLIAGTCFLVFVLIQSVNGMETSLLLLLLALLTVFCEKFRPSETRSFRIHTVLGLLLGLTVLTRLDFVFLCVPVLLLYAYRAAAQKHLRPLLALGIGLALPVLPYLACNQIQFGHLIPISGLLKFNLRPVPLAEKISRLVAYPESGFMAVPVLYGVWFLWHRERLRDSFWGPFLAVTAAGLCLLLLYYLLFLHWTFFSWYFVPYALFFCQAAAIWMDFYAPRFPLKPAPWAYGIVVTGLLAYRIQNYVHYFRPKNNWSLYTYEAAQWAKTHTRPQDILAMQDAGHFGFFAERRVINLDGLVNSFDFQQTLHQKQLNRYLRENKVRYIARHSMWNQEEVTDGRYDAFPLCLVSGLYGSQSDSVLLHKENEVYRSEPYEENGWRVVFLIWEVE